jgi:hypothetical protein
MHVLILLAAIAAGNTTPHAAPTPIPFGTYPGDTTYNLGTIDPATGGTVTLDDGLEINVAGNVAIRSTDLLIHEAPAARVINDVSYHTVGPAIVLVPHDAGALRDDNRPRYDTHSVASNPAITVRLPLHGLRTNASARAAAWILHEDGTRTPIDATLTRVHNNVAWVRIPHLTDRWRELEVSLEEVDGAK